MIYWLAKNESEFTSGSADTESIWNKTVRVYVLCFTFSHRWL